MEKRSELQSWLIRVGLPETVAHEGAQTIGSAWQGPAGFHLPRGTSAQLPGTPLAHPPGTPLAHPPLKPACQTLSQVLKGWSGWGRNAQRVEWEKQGIPLWVT